MSGRILGFNHEQLEAGRRRRHFLLPAPHLCLAPLPNPHKTCAHGVRRCKGRPGSEYVLRAQAPEESPFGCCTNPYCSRNAIVQDLGTIEIEAVRSHRARTCGHCWLSALWGSAWMSACCLAHGSWHGTAQLSPSLLPSWVDAPALPLNKNDAGQGAAQPQAEGMHPRSGRLHR